MKRTQIVILCTSLGLPLSLLAQGSLNPPPGPPERTMKSLHQIEPRIDLTADESGAVNTDDPIYRYVITRSGSYYLTSNIEIGGVGIIGNLPKSYGIRIDASDVTLDMNGFTIKGSRWGNDSGYAITINGDASRVSIFNGTILGRTAVSEDDGSLSATKAGFTYGIFSGSQVTFCRFTNLHVSGCQTDGIVAGEYAVVSQCTAAHHGSVGIRAPGGSVTACTAHLNKNAGIAATGGVIHDCVSGNNGGQSTLKALQQLEPRIDVQNDTTGAVAASSAYRHVISRSGSYYLSSNITVGGLTIIGSHLPPSGGIHITANDVTLDLNGFVIKGSALGNDSGIAIKIDSLGVTVKNGSIRGRTEVRSGTVYPKGFRVGIDGGARLEKLVVSGCRETGIRASSAIISECYLLWNGQFGIGDLGGSVISNCIVRLSGSDGITSNFGTISHCSVFENLGRGIFNSSGVTAFCASSGNQEGNAIAGNPASTGNSP